MSRRLSVAHRPGAVGGRGGLPPAGLAAPHRAERDTLITLPWEDPFSDERVTVPLIFTATRRGAIRRATFDGKSWRPAVAAAGIVPTRATGMHALRYFYASALLDAGKSIKTLASYVPRALRPWVRAAGLHPPDAGQRGTHPQRDRRSLPAGWCGLTSSYTVTELRFWCFWRMLRVWRP
ncbi:hypothetical protein AB0K20_12020 [Micromonospora matsumotoense]|uniref:hypothetical protein n=1 Tax=Micromonospora matsumotoense TaxID=121616 RepID=UPI0034179EDD